MRVLLGLGRVVLLLIGAFAAAGLVLALDHPPSGTQRPELTAVEARRVEAALAGMDATLDDATAAVDSLADAGAEVLRALRAGDDRAAVSARDDGDVAATQARDAAATLRAAGAEAVLDDVGTPPRLPPALADRAAAMTGVPAALEDAARAWSTIGDAVDRVQAGGVADTTMITPALLDLDAARGVLQAARDGT